MRGKGLAHLAELGGSVEPPRKYRDLSTSTAQLETDTWKIRPGSKHSGHVICPTTSHKHPQATTSNNEDALAISAVHCLIGMTCPSMFSISSWLSLWSVGAVFDVPSQDYKSIAADSWARAYSAHHGARGESCNLGTVALPPTRFPHDPGGAIDHAVVTTVRARI